MPPAPTELLLVTRMGDNNSPILLTDVPQHIATFNRPFELSELVGNLDGVMYLYSGEAVNVTCVSDVEEGETKYFLAYDNGEAHIGDLTVDGTALLCSEKGNENYLFDLDYKHQNRKFFELANGTYAVALPWLGLDADSKVLVSVSGESSGKTVSIHYVDNDYRAWGYAAENIREISWFNQLLTSANIDNIVSLVGMLINLEYSSEAAGGIIVDKSGTEPYDSDGDWNLFTDGSPFIPLSIVSRFPNGSPQQSYSGVYCILNRMPSLEEIDGKLSIIAYGGNEIIKTSNWNYDSSTNTYISRDNNKIALIISYVQGQVNVGPRFLGTNYIYYDIDYDHQFRRSLPSGIVKMNVQIPQLLDNPSAGQGIAIVTSSVAPDELDIIANNDNSLPYICQGDTVQNQQGAWANSLTYANVESLLQAIITMEFTGYDEIPIHVQISPYKESSASGFVVTPLIPQTLS